ncbi:MAG TPA: FecR domain-containing protein [Agriterribacter sp.]|nr:FecR domain-containing protein [Agriterribacter sp.]
MDQDQQLKELFRKYLENRCTPAQAEQVFQWLEADEHSSVQRQLINELMNSQYGRKDVDDTELNQVLERNADSIMQKIGEIEVFTVSPRKIAWWRLSAAVMAVIFSGTLAYLWFSFKDTHEQRPVAVQKKLHNSDIQPGRNKAVLILDSGKEVVLDEVKNGDVTQQGNSRIVKVDGRLAYHQEGNLGLVVYNTIATPRGGQYQVVLADGSKVWLNAASSLRYPTSFPGKERVVELTGEGYFEVAKNAEQPFHVKVNNMDVQVLGTHFNIMAYHDERNVKTTLLEGSVKINTGNNTALLEPGQQARLQNASLTIAGNVDVEEVVAWKNGYFQFERNANLQQVMRQIARWYDVEITYEGNIPVRSFGGKISRDSNLSEVLKVLQLSKIDFTIEGRKLIVKP